MADDGGWSTGSGFGVAGRNDARLARIRFDEVLAEFTRRLASPEPMRRETAVALVQQMELLARRMASDEDALSGRASNLEAALDALNARLRSEAAAAAAREAQLTARLDQTLAELETVRATKRPLFGAGAVRLILTAVALCAALCGAGLGVTVLTRPAAFERSAPPATFLDASPEAAVTIAQPEPVVATAPAARPVPPEVTRPLATAATFGTRESYAEVSAALERGDPKAVGRLTTLAQVGDAKAQVKLAGLYEAGRGGVPRDLGAARRWTLRAARGGDRTAMYNAAVFLMEGEGGPQDMREAGFWFRRAAERGVVDAQYNLGMMYEVGRGIEQNAAEARRWYAAAAKAGDSAAAARLADLETPAVRLETTSEVAPAEQVSLVDTQTYLAQQGYYIGPIDGLASPALTAAAQAYMRDHPGRAPGL
ncbi:SEL1-like repeat protein [Phenylobacterium sp. CCH12-B4]|uniref:SEL1-like repeat protein n=2 Tax=unclassified Phenylobacterium TaxID=2640670 RepID=UPI00083B9F85|nr:SEL1-like repeat protein [Phenylobacterium sp. CCH12-B4]